MSVFFVFKLAFWLGICFQVNVKIVTPPPAPYPLRPAPMLFVPTNTSFFNASVTELFEMSARLKLVTVPLSSLPLHIVQ